MKKYCVVDHKFGECKTKCENIKYKENTGYVYIKSVTCRECQYFINSGIDDGKDFVNCSYGEVIK